MLKKVICLMICFFTKHEFGDWVEGKIGKNFFDQEKTCKKCGIVRGNGYVLPPKAWPAASSM